MAAKKGYPDFVVMTIPRCGSPMVPLKADDDDDDDDDTTVSVVLAGFGLTETEAMGDAAFQTEPDTLTLILQSAMKCTNVTGKAPRLIGSPSMWPSCGTQTEKQVKKVIKIHRFTVWESNQDSLVLQGSFNRTKNTIFNYRGNK